MLGGADGAAFADADSLDGYGIEMDSGDIYKYIFETLGDNTVPAGFHEDLEKTVIDKISV
jgi:hypothetical protein